MTTREEEDAARGWLFVQKLIDEADGERFANLSMEEQRAELEKAGVDASRDWDLNELLAMAAAEAAEAKAPPLPG